MEENVISLYQDHAAAWIRSRRMDLFEKPWLDAFCNALPPEGGRVLDLGCGSGRPIAADLIARGLDVTGIDGAAAMVARARASFPAQIWLVADMRALPPLGQFDGLIAWHSLFHLRPEDQRLMFRVFAHIATPGAALLFTSGAARGDAVGSLGGQPLYHGSLSLAEYRDVLRSNGFDVVRHIVSDPRCGDATVWLARKAR